MIKIMRAVAAVMLLATGAQAATVDGPLDEFGNTVTGDLVKDQLYSFHFKTGPLAPLEGYNISKAFMTITGQGQTVTRTAIGQGDPQGVVYGAYWFALANGPADFTVSWYLERYKNASLDVQFTPSNEPIVVGLTFTDNKPIFETTYFNQVSFSTRLAAAPPTAMPLAGTLPLMLSALGLGALVMRRRAKAALA